MNKEIKVTKLWCSINTSLFVLIFILSVFAWYQSSITSTDINSEHNKFIKISLVGDISLARHINEAIDDFNSNFEQFVAEWAYVTRNDDLTFANLESPLTNHSLLPMSDYTESFRQDLIISNDPSRIITMFCAPKLNVKLLKYASIDVVTLANNHVFDCTQFGLLDTMNTLTNNKIAYVGIGDIFSNKQKLIVKQVKGVKIGLLGFYANKRWFDPFNKLKHNKNVTNELNEYNTPSFIDGYLASILCIDLEKYKNILNIDIIIIHVHWLREYIYSSDLSKYEYIKFHNMIHILSECGVDVIVGAHPHVLLKPQWISTVDKTHKTLILWSLGNFVFDSGKVLNRTHKTCLAQLIIAKNTKQITNIRFMEGSITPTFQTILTGKWQNNFCESHL